jgi:hypothetical protein
VAKIEGRVQIAGDLTTLNTKVLNADADKTGELQRREGSLFKRAISSTRGFFALGSVLRLFQFTDVRYPDGEKQVSKETSFTVRDLSRQERPRKSEGVNSSTHELVLVLPSSVVSEWNGLK